MFDLAELDELEAGLSELETSSDVVSDSNDQMINNARASALRAGSLRASSRNLREGGRVRLASVRASAK